ncbi:MAG: hypothetical protein ACXVA9_02340 [Bdellovibrionales bacterium]
MKLFMLFSILSSTLFASIAQSKTCEWSGGNDLYRKATFAVVVTQKRSEISKSSSEDLSINGSWRLKREFKSKDGATWLEFRFPKDKAYQAIIDPDLLKANGSGMIKLWYNNGDGFIASVYTCGK